MKFKNLPSIDKLKENLEYNPKTGTFKWIKRGRGRTLGPIAGNSNLCNTIIIDNVVYMSHRLAWLYVKGNDPGEYEVDRRDKNKLNNKFENLRLATHQQNSANSPIASHNSSGYKGG